MRSTLLYFLILLLANPPCTRSFNLFLLFHDMDFFQYKYLNQWHTILLFQAQKLESDSYVLKHLFFMKDHFIVIII